MPEPGRARTTAAKKKEKTQKGTTAEKKRRKTYQIPNPPGGGERGRSRKKTKDNKTKKGTHPIPDSATAATHATPLVAIPVDTPAAQQPGNT